MKLGVVIHSADAETLWNAFWFGCFALKKRDAVSVFLLGKGAECEGQDNEHFKVTEQIRQFAQAGGKIFACGTCLKSRQSEGSELCPISTMQDLYELVRDSDRVLMFG